MKRIAGAAVFFLGFALFFSAAVYFQSIQSGRMRREPLRVKQWLYLPDSRYVQFTSIGYNHFAADFLWLRAIQNFGGWYAHKEDSPMLVPFFDVITDLDPKFLDVYSFGNMVIGEEAGDHKNGLRLLDKGIEKNPNRYRPAFEGAFFAYWTMNDPDLAKYYVARALKAPDCPSHVAGWTGYFELKMGRFHAGYENLFRDYIRFYNAGNADLMITRLATLRRAIRDWHKAEIRAKAIERRHADGTYPTIAELDAGRALADAEMPDWGLISQVLQAHEQSGEELPEGYEAQTKFILSFIRKGWTRFPSDAFSDNPRFMRYLIWPGQQPTNPKRGGAPGETEDNPNFCVGELEAAKLVIENLNILNAVVADDMQKAGAPCPTAAEAEEKYLRDARKSLLEPWGGDWKFDPIGCRIFISTHPNLAAAYYMQPTK